MAMCSPPAPLISVFINKNTNFYSGNFSGDNEVVTDGPQLFVRTKGRKFADLARAVTQLGSSRVNTVVTREEGGCLQLHSLLDKTYQQGSNYI